MSKTPKAEWENLTSATVQRLTARRLPKHRPPTHPGEMLLEEVLEPLGITQSAFAVRLGVSFPRLNEIIRGKRSVTPDTALRLAKVLGMPADFWLGLQTDWDLWHAMRSESAQEIARLEPVWDYPKTRQRREAGERLKRVIAKKPLTHEQARDALEQLHLEREHEAADLDLSHDDGSVTPP